VFYHQDSMLNRESVQANIWAKVEELSRVKR
jgi:hypothetical protein